MIHPSFVGLVPAVGLLGESAAYKAGGITFYVLLVAVVGFFLIRSRRRQKRG